VIKLRVRFKTVKASSFPRMRAETKIAHVRAKAFNLLTKNRFGLG